ncbi:hypothetical protein, partial [Rhodococcus qingshengii]|uniref:hypothetical protein n=1 Tax=Rhodococcus qingshengii TaxID=334542 RepID=UPI00287F71CC
THGGVVDHVGDGIVGDVDRHENPPFHLPSYSNILSSQGLFREGEVGPDVVILLFENRFRHYSTRWRKG